MTYLEDYYNVTGRKEAITYHPTTGMCVDGYTKRSGAPTPYMVQIDGGKKWYRVMVIQFSNVGSIFIRVGGVRYFIRFSYTVTGE